MIASDGSPFEPLVVDCFYSTSGERFDFILTPTTDRSISELTMRVRALGACESTQVQELARIKIYDDLSQVIESNDDYLPISNYPLYFEPFKNDIVSEDHSMIPVKQI